MPRSALSTLRAEIKDGGPFGASIGLSESASVALVSADTSLELLMWNLRSLIAKVMEFMDMAPFIGVWVEKSFREMHTVAVVDDTAIFVLCYISLACLHFRLFSFLYLGGEIRHGLSTREMLSDWWHSRRNLQCICLYHYKAANNMLFLFFSFFGGPMSSWTIVYVVIFANKIIKQVVVV